MKQRPGFEALPAALHLHVLSFLPLVERVRCAPVARSWAALLADHAFWMELRFDGAPEGSVDDATLLQLCRRAGGRLRTLDVSSSACNAISTRGLIAALASDGLGLALESLCTWAPLRDDNAELQPQLYFLAAAAALAAACPALKSAAVEVVGSFADVAAALRALPGPGEKRVAVEKYRAYTYDPSSPALSLPALADWVHVALDGCSVSELCIQFSGGVPVAAALEEQAAERLAAALAAPERGVRSLSFRGRRGNRVNIGQTPLLGSLCHALSADSPLTELSMSGIQITGAGAAEIAAALAPGRSRLRKLDLGYNGFLAEGGGTLMLLAALGQNETLTTLNFPSNALRSLDAAAALAASLRSNSTLRTLKLENPFRGSPEDNLASIFRALASSTAAPSRCGLTALDVSSYPLGAAGCDALGLALAEPSCRLETLNLEACGIDDAEGTSIFRGLEAAGAASRLRCICCDENELGDAVAAALGRALAAQGANGALRELNLRTNRFGPAAARHLAEGLRINSSLETLFLFDNPQLGSEGAAAIVRGIAGTGGTPSGVRALSLARCGLGDVGVAAMLEAGLLQNATLTWVELSGNDFGRVGYIALAHWAAARFGVAPEGVPLTGAATLLGGETPEEVAAAVSGETASSSSPGGGASQRGFASLGAPHLCPPPLRLHLSSRRRVANAAAMALPAELECILERANAAAAVAGWPHRSRNALEIVMTIE